MPEEIRIPLFPINSVLFPQGPLPLRIFEARYLDMVGNCMRTGDGFGVCLIESGNEVGTVAKPCSLGTLVKIQDWHQRHDGMLSITVIGEQRYRIHSTKVCKNQLMEGHVEMVPNEAAVPLPKEYIPMADFLRQMIKQIPHLFSNIPIRYDDAGWVGSRLAELLPISLQQKQNYLQFDEPIQRLERLREIMDGMSIHY